MDSFSDLIELEIWERLLGWDSVIDPSDAASYRLKERSVIAKACTKDVFAKLLPQFVESNFVLLDADDLGRLASVKSSVLASLFRPVPHVERHRTVLSPFANVSWTAVLARQPTILSYLESLAKGNKISYIVPPMAVISILHVPQIGPKRRFNLVQRLTQLCAPDWARHQIIWPSKSYVAALYETFWGRAGERRRRTLLQILYDTAVLTESNLILMDPVVYPQLVDDFYKPGGLHFLTVKESFDKHAEMSLLGYKCSSAVATV